MHILKNIFRKNQSKYFYRIKILQYFILLMSLPNLCWAGSFHIAPIKGELSEESKYFIFEVRNNAENVSAIQIQAMSWEIVDGKEIIKPTSDIIVTPVIITIKPNVKQIIRLGLNRKPDKQEELFYKILVSEIPSLKRSEIKGTEIMVEFSIPIILKAIENTKTDINIKSNILPNDIIKIELENNGKKHEIIKSIVIKNKKTEFKEIFEKYIYMRPKEKNNFNIKIKNSNNEYNQLKIQLETENGNIESDAISIQK
jgi:fimbrial chaperone protein